MSSGLEGLQPGEVLRPAQAPVLAEGAAQVAAQGAEGEHLRSGQEVVEGLLLDGIHAEAAGAPGHGGAQAPALVQADAAVAPLAFRQGAGPGAEIADHPSALLQVPPAGHREGHGPASRRTATR